MTEKRLDTVIFAIDEIGSIIRGLDPNKVHGQDKISIRMLKICSNSVCKPLEIICKEHLTWHRFVSFGIEKGKHCSHL